ncbi:hypothetical protein chiPu_0028429 [Chiloscyllium punctatum]|uniref:Uncharacterized protein n=1 Tax=Chiloscyllium punctatum TaxID=137246 RepID=A0A401TP29_CHIPU|nr:hypothetical protein [Chiloscyllium punctatum]
MPVDWNAIVAVTQKPGEDAQEYGARKFEAFQAHSGIPDADRQNPAFIQLYKDGLGPTHQAVLRTGLVPYVSFTELDNWAMSLDKQAPATVAALSTPGPLVCYCCRQTGHYNKSALEGRWVPTRSVAALAPYVPITWDWTGDGAFGTVCQLVPEVWAMSKQDCGIVRSPSEPVLHPLHTLH